MEIRSKDVPVTQEQLELVRQELKAEMRSGSLNVDAKLEELCANIFHMGAHIEKQGSENRIVLEHLTTLFRRQEVVEHKIVQTKALVKSIGKMKGASND